MTVADKGKSLKVNMENRRKLERDSDLVALGCCFTLIVHTKRKTLSYPGCKGLVVWPCAVRRKT